MSTTEQKIASALAQINECLYDHGAGKYRGAVSDQQRNQAFDNARFLAVELRRLADVEENLQDVTHQLEAESLRNHNLRQMIRGYQDELAGLRAQVEALTKPQEPVGYFSWSREGGFSDCDTLAEAQAECEEELAFYRKEAEKNGEWGDDVGSICYGIVIGKMREIPLDGETRDGDPIVDYALSTPSPLTRPAVPDKGLLADLIREHMTSVYHCSRVWEGWSVGTMSEDDFWPYAESDSPDELADAILAMLAAPQPEVEVARTAVPVVISDDQIAATAGRLGGFSESRPLSQQWDNVYALVRKVIQERDAAPQPEATIKESSIVPKLPDGWVPCTITFDGSHPEEVAYGPKVMMDRLAKWLDKHFARAIEDAKPKARPTEDQVQAAFETWLYEKRRHGDVESVQRQWEASSDYAGLFGLSWPTEAAQKGGA